MNKKFSIMAINIDKIFDEIDDYVKQGHATKNYIAPYLFMNEETAKAIQSEVNKNNILYDPSLLSNIPNKNTQGGVYATFTGYKVFIDDDLKFGIVEIR